MGYKRHKKLDDHIEEMRNMAERLVSYTYPNALLSTERDVDCLKQRQLTVDGYEIAIHFSKANYSACYVETIEIAGVNMPFLPMYLVCKIAAKFLGGHELKYAECLKRGRKVYVWTIALDDRGRPIKVMSPLLERRSYENFDYLYMSSELI